jgi:hypothetical protein
VERKFWELAFNDGAAVVIRVSIRESAHWTRLRGFPVLEMHEILQEEKPVLQMEALIQTSLQSRQV